MITSISFGGYTKKLFQQTTANLKKIEHKEFLTSTHHKDRISYKRMDFFIQVESITSEIAAMIFFSS